MHDSGEHREVTTAAEASGAALPSTTCPRCGNFAVLKKLWGISRCEACLERRDAIEVAAPTAWNLISASFQLTAKVALPALLIMLVLGTASMWVENKAAALARIFDTAFFGLAGATIQRLAFMRVVHDPKAKVGDAVQTVLARLASLIGSSFMANIISALFALLLIVPGVMRALSYLMSAVIVVNENQVAAKSLELSQARMLGHRKAAFYAIMGMGTLLASVWLAYCVGLGLAFGESIDFEAETLAIDLLFALPAFVAFSPFFLLPVAMQLKLAKPDE